MNVWAGRLLLVIVASLPVAAAHAQSNDDCLACHSDTTLTMDRGRRTVRLYVDPGPLRRSPHADLGCIDCHSGFSAEEIPHKAKITPVNCMDCHSGAAGTHPFHTSMSSATGTDGAPGTSCKQCHGTHDILPLDSPDATFHPSRLTKACGKCHADIARQFAASEHGRALAASEPGAPSCIGCHTNPITATRAGGRSAALKITEEKVCLGCHLDNPDVRARMGPGAGFITAYDESVHGRALHGGNGDAATCIDCHGSHEMKKGTDPSARVSKAHIPETCAACHAPIADQYASSIHGIAVARGNVEAPVCTTCHGEHDILRPSDPSAPVAARNVSTQVCSPCHSSVKLSEKYGIASDRFQTFAASYHGLALRGGSIEAANCTSCHGSHDIKPSADPTSSTHKANLAATCGRCHPGANERFAVGEVHVAMTEEQDPLLYWIASGYILLIVLTVGGMLAHNAIDFARKSVRRLRIRRGAIEEEEPIGHSLYVRMTAGERIQHASLMISFTVLVVTGFMLSYPDAWWVRGIRRMSDNVFELRSLLHRIAAVVMVSASLFHIGYVTLTARGRRLIVDLLPSFDDLHEAIAMMKYNLGLSSARPAFGRFSYIEKSEYWALVWGTVVMAVTGVIMWFENTSIGILTKLGWDVARTIHYYEAWLATLAIIVWHIYYVIFNPDVYPMNLAWLTGKLTEAEMAEEHPRELADLRRKETDTDSTA